MIVVRKVRENINLVENQYLFYICSNWKNNKIFVIENIVHKEKHGKGLHKRFATTMTSHRDASQE